jgi:hypothetical protein
MKREDVREAYGEATGTLSEVIRKLALAGVATIWLAKTGDTHGALRDNQGMQYSLVLFVIALTFDLFQYAYKSAAWGIFNRLKELQGTPPEQEFHAPAAINWPSLFFFWSKVILTALAYVILICIIGKQLLCS